MTDEVNFIALELKRSVVYGGKSSLENLFFISCEIFNTSWCCFMQMIVAIRGN